MSEHKTNPRSIMNDTLPPLLPVGCRANVGIQLDVMPKQNIILLPADKIRTTASGRIEILVGDPEEWRQAPDGADVCELGKPLPPEKCDVVAMLGAMVEDTLGPKLVQPGQRPRGRVSSGPLAIIARAPLDRWQEAHLGTLRGPVE